MLYLSPPYNLSYTFLCVIAGSVLGGRETGGNGRGYYKKVPHKIVHPVPFPKIKKLLSYPPPFPSQLPAPPFLYAQTLKQI